MPTTEQIAARFLDLTLPKREWTHEAHLRVGLWHLLRYFYVAMIADFLDAHDRSRNVDELAEELIEACGDRRLPLDYYSEQSLFSIEARRHWVEPDRRPLPTAWKEFR